MQLNVSSMKSIIILACVFAYAQCHFYPPPPLPPPPPNRVFGQPPPPPRPFPMRHLHPMTMPSSKILSKTVDNEKGYKIHHHNHHHEIPVLPTNLPDTVDVPNAATELNVPQVHVPEIPQVEVPEVPEVTVTEANKVEIPDVPKVETPEIKHVELPDMDDKMLPHPEINVPEVKVPEIDVGHSTLLHLKQFDSPDIPPEIYPARPPRFPVYPMRDVNSMERNSIEVRKVELKAPKAPEMKIHVIEPAVDEAKLPSKIYPVHSSAEEKVIVPVLVPAPAAPIPAVPIPDVPIPDVPIPDVPIPAVPMPAPVIPEIVEDRALPVPSVPELPSLPIPQPIGEVETPQAQSVVKDAVRPNTDEEKLSSEAVVPKVSILSPPSVDVLPSPVGPAPVSIMGPPAQPNRMYPHQPYPYYNPHLHHHHSHYPSYQNPKYGYDKHGYGKHGVNIIGSTIVHINKDDEDEDEDDSGDRRNRKISFGKKYHREESASDEDRPKLRKKGPPTKKPTRKPLRARKPETVDEVLSALNNYQN